MSVVFCPPVGRPPFFNTEYQTVPYRRAFKIIRESGIPLGFKLQFNSFETQTRKGSDVHASAVRFKREMSVETQSSVARATSGRAESQLVVSALSGLKL
jgi:hypothetical protein